MSLNMTNPFIAVPAGALYCGLGALVSGVVFNKLSHIAEYTLNKTFGDYKNPQKTLDNRVIVSMGRGNDYYALQNIVLGALVALISYKAVQILALAACPSVIAVPLLVGSVAAPILFALFNILLRSTGGHHGRWVHINDDEIKKHGINKNTLETIAFSVRVYFSFGSAPTYCPGEQTESY